MSELVEERNHYIQTKEDISSNKWIEKIKDQSARDFVLKMLACNNYDEVSFFSQDYSYNKSPDEFPTFETGEVYVQFRPNAAQLLEDEWLKNQLVDQIKDLLDGKVEAHDPEDFSVPDRVE